MNALSTLFPDFDAIVAYEKKIVFEKPTLILAITPRTGSTHLCSMLKSLEIFGSPQEILNNRGVVQRKIKQLEVKNFSEYIEKLVNEAGECFSFKASWSDFEPISSICKEIFPNLKFIYLDRFDIVAQAISLFRASETKIWHNRAGNELQYDKLSLEQLDVNKITTLMQMLIKEKIEWEKYFFTNNLSVEHLYYEVIRHNWTRAAAMIAERFGYFNITPGNGEYLCLSDENDINVIREFKALYGYSWCIG